jgi:hypothetical protein
MDDLQIPDPQQASWNTAYAECVIQAPQQLVWQALTDFAAYDTWNRFTYDVKMPRFAVGEEFSFTVHMARWFQREQRERLLRIDAPQTLVWGYPYDPNPWLNATRYQVVTAQGPNTTAYRTWETFTGVLVPLLKVTVFGMVQRGFDRCAHDLKAHCEARANGDH